MLSWLLLRCVTFGGDTILALNQATQVTSASSYSLWVGRISMGDGHSSCWGRNTKFCIAVTFVTKTVGTLARLALADSGAVVCLLA